MSIGIIRDTGQGSTDGEDLPARIQVKVNEVFLLLIEISLRKGKHVKMSARCIVLIVCVVVSIANSTVLGLEHCGMNNYRQSLNSSHMQYTREPVNREYAVLNQFKSLHCCAKGYRSIEWLVNHI